MQSAVKTITSRRLISARGFTSKAMQRKLRRAEQQNALQEAEQQHAAPAPYQQPTQLSDPQPMTFGQSMKQSFVLGIGLSLGFMFIAVVLRAVGMEAADAESQFHTTHAQFHERENLE